MLKFSLDPNIISISIRKQVSGVFVPSRDIATPFECLHVYGSYGTAFRISDVDFDLIPADYS